MLKMGETAKDKITGYEGIIIGKCSYITGCNQYWVQPKVKEGAWVEAKWFDENRLEKIECDVIVLDDDHKDGSCESAPIK